MRENWAGVTNSGSISRSRSLSSRICRIRSPRTLTRYSLAVSSVGQQCGETCVGVSERERREQTDKSLLESRDEVVATEDGALAGCCGVLQLVLHKHGDERQRAVTLVQDVHCHSRKAVVFCRVENLGNLFDHTAPNQEKALCVKTKESPSAKRGVQQTRDWWSAGTPARCSCGSSASSGLCATECARFRARCRSAQPRPHDRSTHLPWLSVYVVCLFRLGSNALNTTHTQRHRWQGGKSTNALTPEAEKKNGATKKREKQAETNA